MNVYALSTVSPGPDLLRLIRGRLSLAGIIGLSEREADDAISGYTHMGPLAEELGLNLIEVESYSLKGAVDRDILSRLDIDVLLVLGWQRLVPEWLIKQCRIGVIGVHGSWAGITGGRGRSPQNWAIILGKKSFSLSLFFIDANVDSGPVICTRTFPISPNDDIATSYTKTCLATADMLITAFAEGTISRRAAVVQDENGSSYLPQRKPEDGAIDWNTGAEEIDRFVRALTRPYPGAFAEGPEGGRITFWRVRPILIEDLSAIGKGAQPGDIVAEMNGGSELLIKCCDGFILAQDWTAERIRPIIGLRLVSADFHDQMRKIAERHLARYPDMPLVTEFSSFNASQSPSELTVVVPAYNEGENVAWVVSQIKSVFGAQGVAPAILIVDDGSDDDTARIVAKLVDADPERVSMLRHESNQGLGVAIRNGYRHANTRWLGWLPGDGQFLAEDLLRLYQCRDGNAAVIGRVPASDRVGADNIIRLILSWGLRVTMRALHPAMPSFNGVMVLRTDAVDVDRLVCGTGFINMEILDRIRRRKSGPVVEEIITIIPRRSGSSKVANVKTTLRVVWDLFRLRLSYLLKAA